MEDLLLNSCTKEIVSLSESFSQLYSSDINIEKLKIQLLLLPDLLSTYNEKEGIAVHRVTSIITVIDLTNSNSLTKVKWTNCYEFILQSL